MALKIYAKFERKLTWAFKMTWIISQIFVHRLKKSDFILTSKIAKLNQNRNSKQPDWPDTE